MKHRKVITIINFKEPLLIIQPIFFFHIKSKKFSIKLLKLINIKTKGHNKLIKNPNQVNWSKFLDKYFLLLPYPEEKDKGIVTLLRNNSH